MSLQDQLTPDARKSAYAYVAIALLSVLVFAKGMNYELLHGFDDDSYILNNIDRIELSSENVVSWFTAAYANNYIPLTMLSYMVDYAVGGTDGTVYHLQNLFWHIVAGFGLFTCLQLLRVRFDVALGLTLLWAVHPQRVESVIWVSERKDVLCGAWYLWGIAAYIHLRDGTGTRPFRIPFACFLLALLAKPMAISFPFLLILFEWYRAKEIDARAIAIKVWPYLVTSAAFIPITVAAQGTAIQSHLSLGRRFGVLFHNLAWYIHSLFLPISHSTLYPRVPMTPGAILPAAVVLVACAVAVTLYIRRTNTALAIWLPLLLTYPIVLGPVAGFMPLGAIDYADRYSYLPSAMILAIIGLAITHCCPTTLSQPSSRRRLATAFTVLIIAAAAVAITRIPVWQSIRHVMVSAVSYPKPNPKALIEMGNWDLAHDNLESVASIANMLLSSRPGYITERGRETCHFHAHYFRLKLARTNGDKNLAVRSYEALTSRHDPNEIARRPILEHFVRSNDELVQIVLEIAGLYLEAGLNDRVVECLDSALFYAPKHFEARMARARNLLKAGDTTGAQLDAEAALRLKPESPIAKALLADCQKAKQQKRQTPPPQHPEKK